MRVTRILAVVAIFLAAAGNALAQGDDTGAAPANPPVIVINPAQGVENSDDAPEPAPEAEVAKPVAPAKQLDAKTEEAAEAAAMSEAAEVSKAEEKKAEQAPPAPALKPTLHINIDLAKQRMTVSDKGRVLHTWPISSGRYRYRTPTGTFKPVWMTKEWYSRQYDFAPMPYSIFFNGGVAIHATQATSMLGRPASHGCVRLSYKNAAMLYGLVSKHGKAMTKIVVHGTPDFDTEVAERGDDRRYNGRRVAQYRYYDDYDYYPPPPSMRSRYYSRPYARRYERWQPRSTYRPRGFFGGDGYYPY